MKILLRRATPGRTGQHERDPLREENHRVRLAAVLQQCPKLSQVWFHEGSVTHAEFGKDIAGGFKEETLRQQLLEAGFSRVEFHYHWFLGEGFLINSGLLARAELMQQAMLNLLLPVSGGKTSRTEAASQRGPARKKA